MAWLKGIWTGISILLIVAIVIFFVRLWTQSYCSDIKALTACIQTLEADIAILNEKHNALDLWVTETFKNYWSEGSELDERYKLPKREK